MSQLADIEDVVTNQPMTDEQQASLFYDILQCLHWEIDGVNSPEDAMVYLMRDR